MSEAHAPTAESRQLVGLMTAAGFAQGIIAPLLRISVPTLTAHYDQELKSAKGEYLSRVAQMAFAMALGRPAQYDAEGRQLRAEVKPDRAMVMFILKTQGGWKETSVVEVSDPTAGARERLASAIDRVLAAQLGEGGAEAGSASGLDQQRPN